jgi:hypothetical protein
MRTVISHFYNEAYLLPWWLKHHRELFDYGILINHGSTDESLDIIRELVPHWKVVNSTLTYFNAYLTDLEVMNYEKEVVGWKIALNTTEFLLSTVDLSIIEAHLESGGRVGATCSGYILIDNMSDRALSYDTPLLSQIHFGFSDNQPDISAEKRLATGIGIHPGRNRFYHKNIVGMYYPGRHRSFHPDANYRLEDLLIFHCHHAPWNEQMMQRKLGIASKLDPEDIKHRWGFHHLRSSNELSAQRETALSLSYDLTSIDYVNRALMRLQASITQ